MDLHDDNAAAADDDDDVLVQAPCSAWALGAKHGSGHGACHWPWPYEFKKYLVCILGASWSILGGIRLGTDAMLCLHRAIFSRDFGQYVFARYVVRILGASWSILGGICLGTDRMLASNQKDRK